VTLRPVILVALVLELVFVISAVVLTRRQAARPYLIGSLFAASALGLIVVVLAYLVS